MFYKILEIKFVALVCCLIIFGQLLHGQTSTLVSIGTDGKLVYTSDSKGNRIPDFSGVGYKNSETTIPSIAVVRTVSPRTGDNLLNIQSAIDEVSTMPLNLNGFRGAILFKAGRYFVDGTITISASGIVLIGEGSSELGTCFIASKPKQHTLFSFVGKSGTSIVSTSRSSIIDSYVPIGEKEVRVTSGHTFVKGDNVFIHWIPNSAWINKLGMDTLSRIKPLTTDWSSLAYDVYYERQIIQVDGNKIILDAPFMDVIDQVYTIGELVKYTSSRIDNCGIENMRISSSFSSEIDEDHGWEAVSFENSVDCWARNLDVYYFGYSAVHIHDGSAWITVDNCKMTDAKSLIKGGRRYSFNVDGQRCLIENCIASNGRHDYVNGSRTPGPNVFYNCRATNQKNDIGPHHRWSTGILYDNIIGDGKINIQNRTTSGTGHGWAGAQILFWNCDGTQMVIQDPPGDDRNWAIGCNIKEITNISMTIAPLGLVESKGIHISAIPSLFKAQLKERLQSISIRDK